MKMKKAIVTITAGLILAVTSTGCFTSAGAITERYEGGKLASRSKVSVIGTGDKASQIATSGLFADGGDGDLGAGLHDATASQQSSGIDGAIRSVAEIALLLDTIAARRAGMAAPSEMKTLEYYPPTPEELTIQQGGIPTPPPATGYNGKPGEGGVGVYGHHNCGLTRAYQERHGVEIINTDYPDNLAALRAALRARGKPPTEGIKYPVVVTADDYTEQAR